MDRNNLAESFIFDPLHFTHSRFHQQAVNQRVQILPNLLKFQIHLIYSFT